MIVSSEFKSIPIMLMLINGEILDCELNRLSKLFDLLDSKLVEINKAVKVSKDPVTDGLCDEAEYYVGIGFTAAQQYLVDTLLFMNFKDKNEAFKLGPAWKSESYALIINAAANYWKHEAEWWNNGEVHHNGVDGFLRLRGTDPSDSFVLANTLFNICEEENEVLLKGLMPYLIQWRDEVYKNVSEMPNK